MYDTIQSKQLYDLFSQNQSPQVIDLRDQDEYIAGHVPGALNIPFLFLRQQPNFVPDGLPVVLYGADESGENQERLQQAVQFLQEQEVEVSVLEGGLAAWAQAGLPLEIE